METLFVTRNATLKRRENTLSISVDGKTRPFPIEKIRHIILLSESTLNSKLLCLCGANGVRISVFDYYGYFKGAFEPIDHNPAGRIKLEQAKTIMDDIQKMMISREIVRGATLNMQANFLYYRYRGYDELDIPIREMSRISEKIEKASDTETLMGIEGNLHGLYYNGWKLIDPALDFGPPNSPTSKQPDQLFAIFLESACIYSGSA